MNTSAVEFSRGPKNLQQEKAERLPIILPRNNAVLLH